MKQFWIYNLMRFVVLLTSLVIVIGVWALLADEVPLLWAMIVAFVLSGVSSWYLLAPQRQALALVLEERAGRASDKFEEFKAKGDED